MGEFSGQGGVVGFRFRSRLPAWSKTPWTLISGPGPQTTQWSTPSPSSRLSRPVRTWATHRRSGWSFSSRVSSSPKTITPTERAGRTEPAHFQANSKISTGHFGEVEFGQLRFGKRQIGRCGLVADGCRMRRPGIGTTTGAVANSQTRRTCCGLIPRPRAIRANAASDEPSSAT